MIKKIIITGIITLGLFNFTNATDLYLTKIGNIGEYLQTTQSNPEFTVQEKGNLNSIQLGNSKNFLALSDTDFTNVKNKKYFRWNNGKAYFYWSLTGSSYTPNLVAGEFIKYYYCDNFSTGNNVNNCSLNNYQNNLKSFFSSISSSDNFGYYVKSVNQNSIDLRICFSSNSIGKSVCFDNTNTGFYNQIDMTENLSFNDFPSSLLGNSPAGGKNIYQNINNNTICPTIRQIMQNMGENYNTGLCYNNTTYFNGTNFEQIEKEDIFTIFNNDYENYTNRTSIYWNNCNTASTQQRCGDAFTGEYKKYSIISNAINSKVDKRNLRNYCNLGLNFDPNATTCVLSGNFTANGEILTTEELIENITNNGIIPAPNTNTGTGEENNVLNALTKCENGGRDCYLNNRNFIESLTNIYGKITGLFKERKNVNGIIPEYILRITFITILFTVIFKK